MTPSGSAGGPAAAAPRSPRRLPAWALPVLLPAALGLPFLAGKLLLFRDILIFTVPYGAFQAQAFRQGRLPQWNPHVLGGIPFLADPQSAVFYPLNLVYLALPPERAATLFVLLHLPIAGLGAYLLARSLRVGERYSSLAGVGYATSGYFISLHCNPPYVAAAAWLPLVVAALLRLAQAPSLLRLAASACAVGLLGLTGEPQSLAFACGTGLLVGIAEARPRLRAAGLLAAAIGLGALVAGVQLLPTLLYSQATSRSGGLLLANAAGKALHPVRWLEFLVASPFGMPFPENTYWGGDFVNSSDRQPWSYSLFLGPVFVLPVLMARLRSMPAGVKVLAALVPASLLLAAGPFLPFFRWWFEYVPLANLFRTPEKYALLATLALVLLSAWALERIVAEGTRRAFVPFAVAGLLTLACVGVNAWPEPVLALIQSGLKGEPFAISAEGALGRLLVSLAVAGIACALLGAIVLRARAGRGVTAPLLALAAAGALWTGWTMLSYGDARLAAPDWAGALPPLAQPAAAGRIVRDQTCSMPNRSMAEGEGSMLERYARWLVAIGFGNLPMLFGLDADTGYVAAMPELPIRLRSRLQEQPGGAFQWARLVGAVARLGCDEAGRPVLSGLPPAMPRVSVLPVQVETEEQIFERLGRTGFDPTAAALVSQPIPLEVDPGRGPPAARAVEDEPERVRVEVKGSGGLLVLGDTYAEGWTAQVDGRRAPVYRADALWRGVPVPPGDHEVVFAYTAPGLVTGGALSLLALAGCATLAGLSLRRRREAAAAGPVAAEAG